MSFDNGFVRMKGFWMAWEKLGLGEAEDLAMEAMLAENPNCGRVMAGTGGLRKARLAVGGGGKSGGCRVCYVHIESVRVFLLVYIYGKNQEANLTAAQRNEFRDLLRLAIPHFEKRFRLNGEVRRSNEDSDEED